ncbi:Canalicular multispecific organic anion transporter 1 [Smittium culicis]|uniref:Canalicular multispecific organic anion transporter 1 n=1 Tax=Smittium culicis TaxID=133412 RepID=A0A1R1XBJ2_9FUNG|nr:Canalicular multispecific organic anion transporter 1 [Smittium culicis]
MYSKFETDSVSLERLSEYSNIEPEKETDFDYECNNEKIYESWPKNGEIKFKNYSCSYSKDLPPALSNINLEIKAGEKLGIVGRTGAGKSSFALTLFRAIEELTGSITIDGVDIKSIELCKLRSRISIIPQDPSVFYGSIRFNLSPFDTTEDSRKISDKEMWEALELVNLKCIVESMEGGLSANVLSGENSMSIGQRQQLCLARAIIRKSKIIVLDEATAAIDPKTENHIQSIIKTAFKNKTVITIAHKIHTILDCDNIIVMKSGKIAEYGRPKVLLADPDSYFFSLFHNQSNIG